MLGEYFIDSCITLCCSLDNSPQYLRLFEAILSIMNWYRSEISRDDTPIEFMDKIDLVHYISTYRVHNKNLDFEKMLLGMKNGKLKELIPILEEEKKELTEENIKDLISVIFSKKKVCDLIIGKDKLQHLLEDIETGNYIDDVEICERWEHEISRNYTKITEIKRANSINDIASLDLIKDDYTAVEDSIRERYNPKNIMRTGYKSVDNLFPANGIEKGRFYIVGGTSGVGKSNFMVNLFCNAIIGKGIEVEDDGIFLYLTGENLIDESLERTYCCLSGEYHSNMVNKILTDADFSLKKDISKLLKNHRANIIMRHFRAGATTSADIATIVEEVATLGKLKAVYLDYLDLTRSGLKMDDLRLDLNQACLDYKEIAKDYRIPFITCTQLNRSGYDKDLAPSLISMSESMKKVDNADFVLFLQPADTPTISIPFNGGQQKHYKKVKMTVLKNRNGETGNSTHLVMATRLDNEKIFNYRMEEMPKIAETPTVAKDYIKNNGWEPQHAELDWSNL